MQKLRYSLVVSVVGGLLALAGCASQTKAVDVTGTIRDSIKLAGLKDVTVTQDRDKGVVTLGGHVEAAGDKARAEATARSLAPNQVVANEIAVLPPGSEAIAKDINSDLDKGIDKNLDAALLEGVPREDAKEIKHEVKNGVVTLTGEVNSPRRRDAVQALAAAVPNVQQVVNKLEVKNQKATSTP